MRTNSPEFPANFGHRCVCCAPNGVMCADTKGGRNIMKLDDTDRNGMIVATSIRDCLSKSVVDFEPPDIEFIDPEIGVEDFSGNTDQNTASDLWHETTTHRWINILDKFVTHFATPTGKSKKIPKDQEPNGVASELIVFEVLGNHELLPWIDALQLHSRDSTADSDGIDITIKLDPFLTDLLGNSQVFIQVKSDPGAFQQFINKYERKHKLTEGSGRVRLLQQYYMLLNGGAGRVTDPGIIGPFVAQLHQLICLHNSEAAGAQFLELLDPRLLAILEQTQTIEILSRDYAPILV